MPDIINMYNILDLLKYTIIWQNCSFRHENLKKSNPCKCKSYKIISVRGVSLSVEQVWQNKLHQKPNKSDFVGFQEIGGSLL